MHNNDVGRIAAQAHALIVGRASGPNAVHCYTDVRRNSVGQPTLSALTMTVAGLRGTIQGSSNRT